MLSGSRNYFMIGMLISKVDKTCKAEAIICKEAAVTRISQNRGCSDMSVVWTIPLFLSESRHDYGVILCLS